MAVLVLAVLVLAVLAHNYASIRALVASAELDREASRVERAELALKIVAPERAVIRQAAQEPVAHVVPEDEGELAKVGQIVWGDGE